MRMETAGAFDIQGPCECAGVACGSYSRNGRLPSLLVYCPISPCGQGDCDVIFFSSMSFLCHVVMHFQCTSCAGPDRMCELFFVENRTVRTIKFQLSKVETFRLRIPCGPDRES